MSSWSTSNYILHKRNKLYAMSKRRGGERERGGREGGREGERQVDYWAENVQLQVDINDGNINISNTGFINN